MPFTITSFQEFLYSLDRKWANFSFFFFLGDVLFRGRRMRDASKVDNPLKALV